MRYAAPPGCPGVDGYLTDVRSRATRLNVEPEPFPGAGDTTVEVNVEPEAGTSGWRGRVAITGERALEREVRSERCEDVVAALALITVLRLEGADSAAADGSPAGAGGAAGSGASAGARPGGDAARAGSEEGASASAEPLAPEPGVAPSPGEAVTPGAEAPPAAATEPGDDPRPVEPTEPTEPAREPEPPEAGAAEASPAEPELPEPLAAEPSIVVPPSEREGDDDADATDDDADDATADDADDGVADVPEPPRDPWRWPVLEAGVAVYAGYASVPAQALKASLEGELRFGEGMSSWALLLSLGVAHGDSPVPSGELGLTLLSAQLGLCPPAFVNETSVWLRACASARGGGLRSTVSSSDPTFLAEFDQKWRPWLALGPALSAGVPLSERVALRGLVEVAAQLVRDRYGAEQPNEETGLPEPFVVYEPEPLSIELGLGIGYTF